MVLGGRALDKVIQQVSRDNESFTKVNLCGKNISDDGLIRLAKALASNSYITTMDLSQNNLGPDGASALASALEQNMSVSKIKLNSNAFGNRGAIALARSLRDNMTLTSLQMKDNGIGNEGAVAIFDAISTNRTILSLDLEGNSISRNLLSRINAFVKESKSLHEGGGKQVIYFDYPGKSDTEVTVKQKKSPILSITGSSNPSTADPTSSNFHDSEHRSVSIGIASWNDIRSSNTRDKVNYGVDTSAFQTPSNDARPPGGAALALNWIEMVGAFVSETEENKRNQWGHHAKFPSNDPVIIWQESTDTNSNAEDDSFEDEVPEIAHYDSTYKAPCVTGRKVDPSLQESEQSGAGKRKYPYCCPFFPSQAFFILIMVTLIVGGISGILLGTQYTINSDDSSVAVMDTTEPTAEPTAEPTSWLTSSLTQDPITSTPSQYPSSAPSQYPSSAPSQYPSSATSQYPSSPPSQYPSSPQSQYLSSLPSYSPTIGFSSYSLSKVGQTLPGKAPFDQFGYSVSLSNDGSILAVGSPRHDADGALSDSGLVKVYQAVTGHLGSSSTIWSTIGEITGMNASTFLGHSVCLSHDGKRLAFSEPGYLSRRGRVRIHQFVDSEWVPLGQELIGSNDGDLFGYSVALSGDGNHITIGSPRYSDMDDTYGSIIGRVQSYQIVDWKWELFRPPIDGLEYHEEFGFSVATSYDGAIVAAGAPSSPDGGSVRIYRYQTKMDVSAPRISDTNGGWEILGSISNHPTDSSHSDQFGYSISLSSDGMSIVIGSPMFANSNGMAAVFKYDSSSLDWLSHGEPILGGESALFGRSVVISSDGNFVAVGSPGDTENGIDSGQVQVYRWNGSIWEGSQPKVDGLTKDELGTSVALSKEAKFVAAGAPVRGGESDGSRGYTHVYMLGI